ncbi:hypothetical protein [Streptomyces sp. NBC_01431]|uniref:hypothetical protein n=1 Tax=Streptomyces sp. NBC_01431 TaxID=2903863 RepID=UPI002E37D62C|nr:hypothetical protein [Streptomyces sp. NBC_01431]
MNPEDILASIRAHWPDIRCALDDEQRELLIARLEALALASADERAVRRSVQGVRLALLAPPPSHLVRSALDGTRLVGPSVAAPTLTEAARELHAWLTALPPDTATEAALAAAARHPRAAPDPPRGVRRGTSRRRRRLGPIRHCARPQGCW